MSNMQTDSGKSFRASRRFFGVAAAVLLGLPVAAEAQQQPQQAPQQQPQQAPQQQAQQPKSPWTKLCDKINAPAAPPAEGKPAEPATTQVNLCVTLQERVNNTDGGLVFSGSVRQQEGTEGDFLTVIVPLGLDLRGGVSAKIDDGKPIKLDYMSCIQVGCTAEIKLPGGALESMKKGNELIIEATGPNKKPVRFTLPLTGFAATFDGQPTDLQQYQQSRQQVIAAIRARRQQQIQQAVQEADQRRAQQQQQQQAAPPAAPPPAPPPQ